MTKAKDCMSIRLFAISVPLVEETAGKASSKKSWNESTLPTSFLIMPCNRVVLILCSLYSGCCSHTASLHVNQGQLWP